MGIYGNSGSGKSTFVDLISGLTKPHSGNIYSDELDIYENLSLWRKKIKKTVFIVIPDQENFAIRQSESSIKASSHDNKTIFIFLISSLMSSQTICYL